MKKLLAVFLLVAAAAIVWKVAKAPEPAEEIAEVPQVADDIALYARDQGLTQELAIAIAALYEPGFIVARETQEGAVGSVAGTTALLQAGRWEDVPLSLATAPEQGDSFQLMLHVDSNGNGEFDEAADEPMRDKAGNRVFVTITAQ